MRLKITKLDEFDRAEVRNAACHARDFYPNDGDTSPQRALQIAFSQIRRHVTKGEELSTACSRVVCDALRYEDM